MGENQKKVSAKHIQLVDVVLKRKGSHCLVADVYVHHNEKCQAHKQLTNNSDNSLQFTTIHENALSGVGTTKSHARKILAWGFFFVSKYQFGSVFVR